MDFSTMTDEQLREGARAARGEKQAADLRLQQYLKELEARAGAEYSRCLAADRDVNCICPYDVLCTCRPNCEE